MFRKAERKKAKLRLGLCGASGSGKTWSALEIATGMGGKIAMIDTEAGRGELYGDNFQYDVVRLDAPYSPEKYIACIKEAEGAGYDTLIIDSLSHAWVGDGGILSIVDKAGSSFTAGWKVGTPKHNALIDAIITSKLHIITTMRTKTEYVIETNDRGKSTPRKIGLAPVQRDGLEYEFTVFMDISSDHIAHITKDNTQLFDQQYIKITKDMGIQLMEWLNSGIDFDVQKIKDCDAYIESITQSSTLDALERSFNQAKFSHLRNDPLFIKIVNAKDNMKLKLISTGAIQ